MAILKILHIPDKRLRKVAEPVKKVNKEVHHIVNDMLDTMHAEKGIGLAATQVNIHQRIIVIDISENHKDYLVMINPEIIKKSGKTGIEEGCLSIPEQRAFIPRAKEVEIKAINLKGDLFELKADNLLAICIQHEMDHLIGRLFIDYLSPLKKRSLYQNLDKFNRSRYHKI